MSEATRARSSESTPMPPVKEPPLVGIRNHLAGIGPLALLLESSPELAEFLSKVSMAQYALEALAEAEAAQVSGDKESE